MTCESKSLQKEECHSPQGTERTSKNRVFHPSTDIFETKEGIVLLADMPGVDERDLEITLEKNLLSIRAKTSFEKPKSDFHLAFAEYEDGDFERNFVLSNEIDREGIQAELKDGVLRLTLQKAKESQPIKISVKSA